MIGQTLTHYRITDKLGQGGMGEVYRAEDTVLARQVAIKVLADIFAGDPERVRSKKSDVRQPCISSTVGAGKEPIFRSTAMQRNPVSSGGRPQCPLLRLVVKTAAVTSTHVLGRRARAASVICRIRSGRIAVIVPQHSAESLPAPHLTGRAAHFLPRFNQPVAKPLMVALRMKVIQEFSHGHLQRSLPEEDHTLDAFLLDRSHEAFEMRIQIRRARR